MTVDDLVNAHSRAQYEGPEADICSACCDVIRDIDDTHVCPRERRSGLQRRISKPYGWYPVDLPRNDARRGQQHAVHEPRYASDQETWKAVERRKLPTERRA